MKFKEFLESSLKVNDKVKFKKKFSDGYTENKVFTITRVRGSSYSIKSDEKINGKIMTVDVAKHQLEEVK